MSLLPKASYRWFFAELVLTSSTGYVGGAGNYLGASLGAGGYGAGNVGHWQVTQEQFLLADGDADVDLHHLL